MFTSLNNFTYKFIKSHRWFFYLHKILYFPLYFHRLTWIAHFSTHKFSFLSCRWNAHIKSSNTGLIIFWQDILKSFFALEFLTYRNNYKKSICWWYSRKLHCTPQRDVYCLLGLSEVFTRTGFNPILKTISCLWFWASLTGKNLWLLW